MNNSLLNKGTAFTEAERDALGLRGLLPPQVMTIEQQLVRALGNFRRKADALEKYVFLTTLQNRNETLFYRLVQEHAEEMIPIIYTPTVGQACLEYGAIFRRPRGLFISIKDKGRIAEVLRHWPIIDVRMIVVTDGERILGLGDLGALGMGIPVGKLALYTACAGLHPYYTLPITLDVGTDNVALHDDPLYIGLHQKRVRGAEYDEFIEEFVQAVKSAYPKALIQWEDFGNTTAFHILRKYEKQVCSFNDDIQGTSGVACAAVLAGLKGLGKPLHEAQIVIFGAGTAGCGIAVGLERLLIRAGLTPEEARLRLWLIDRPGLLHTGLPELPAPVQPYAHGPEELTALGLDPTAPIGLQAVVEAVQPAVLIGTSTVAGAFDQAVIEALCRGVERPIVLPLSNPTPLAEITPAHLLAWSEGRALVATGSPFEPVACNGRERLIGQCNNCFVFPGLGYGALAVGARMVSDGMIDAALEALADAIPAARDPDASLMPALADVQAVSERVAEAVALAALQEGLATKATTAAEANQRLVALRWRPDYPEVVAV